MWILLKCGLTSSYLRQSSSKGSCPHYSWKQSFMRVSSTLTYSLMVLVLAFSSVSVVGISLLYVSLVAYSISLGRLRFYPVHKNVEVITRVLQSAHVYAHQFPGSKHHVAPTYPCTGWLFPCAFYCSNLVSPTLL